MEKVCITLVLSADRRTVRKIKNLILLIASKCLVSCSTCVLEKGWRE